MITGIAIGTFIGGMIGVVMMCIVSMAKDKPPNDMIFNSGKNRIVQTRSGGVCVYELTKDGWEERFHTYSPPNMHMNKIELIEYGKYIVFEYLPMLERTENKINEDLSKGSIRDV